MSDAQQGLPRYTGTGAFGKVADALNLHSGCIEDLDATGMVSNARYSGRSGSVTAKPRAPRSGSANHAGDFKRFAMRIAKDTDGNEKLFIGKGGVQIETATASSRIELAETKKDPITDGIVYIDYVQEGGTATIEYETSISPTAGHYYVRIGKTPKHAEATAQWALPEQWLTTDAYLMLQGDPRVDRIIDIIPTDSIATDTSGSPIYAPLVPEYSFQVKVADDAGTWKATVHDGIVRGRIMIPASVDTGVVVDSEVLSLTANTNTNVFLVVSLTVGPGPTQAWASGYTLSADNFYGPDDASIMHISNSQTVAIEGNVVCKPPVFTFFENASVVRVFRIASITWANGTPTVIQRQNGDISADFDVRVPQVFE